MLILVKTVNKRKISLLGKINIQLSIEKHKNKYLDDFLEEIPLEPKEDCYKNRFYFRYRTILANTDNKIQYIIQKNYITKFGFVACIQLF